MWNVIKQIFLFKAAKNSSRGMARMVGLGRLGTVIGIVSGIMALRRHRQAYR